ncbi:MFS family permease [Methanolinea mesophila]|uniref:MFS transporter n=1 Tax=Methanolinea mesophila TaxID=547055 RepID=UPI001AE46DAC|nr:MFS transporter [Methanolinea mesophila]MBP1928284.1 MFS family permease [Methanolinea mesophila]
MTEEYSSGSKRMVRLTAALGSAAAPFMVASIIVASPEIGREFSADVVLLGWVTAAFFLTAASFLIPFGRIADIRGAKKVFTTGLAMYVVSAVISAAAPDIYVLIAGRALTGIGAAMIFGTSIALLSLVFPPHERGKAIGINVTAMFVGFVSGLLLGGLLTTYVGWRSIFLVVAVIAVADLALILTRVRGECEIARINDYDPLGMVLCTGGILLSVYGLSGVGNTPGRLALVAGLLVLGAFFIRERHTPHPLVHRGFGTVTFAASAVTNIIFNGGSFAVSFLLSLYFQYVDAIDPALTGVLLIVPQVFTVLIGPFSGALSDRISPRLVAAAGALVNGLGVLLLVSLGAGTPLVLVILSLALNGVGIALFMPSVITWAMAVIPGEYTGVASGITETSRLAGITVSNAVVIIVFGVFMGGAQVTLAEIPAFLASTRACFLVYLGLSVAAAIVAVLVYRREHRHVSTKEEIPG